LSLRFYTIQVRIVLTVENLSETNLLKAEFKNL
jgi:hypothetical protein